MNKHIEKRTISPSSNGNGLRFIVKRLLEPRAVLFSIALAYFILEFINAMQKKENPFVFNRWMFVQDLMTGPLLMLFTAVLILFHRLSTTALAIAIAAYLFYVTGYRGMISIPDSHGVSILSWDALRIWFKAMPNNLILQAMFATAALLFGTVQLGRLARMRHKRLS